MTWMYVVSHYVSSYESLATSILHLLFFLSLNEVFCFLAGILCRILQVLYTKQDSTEWQKRLGKWLYYGICVGTMEALIHLGTTTCVFIFRPLFTKFTCCLHLTGYKNQQLVVHDFLRLSICLINFSVLILVKLQPYYYLLPWQQTETLKWWLEGALPVSSHININKV